MNKVLVFDPSGNHTEGNGTSGWALFIDGQLTDFGDVKATDFTIPEAYWNHHIYLIAKYWPGTVVYETYRLRAGKAMEQSWSNLETAQLIGYIRGWCWASKIPTVGQDPSLKERFKDDVLLRTGFAEKGNGNYVYIKGQRTNMHMRDAIRHGLYYHRFGKGKQG